MLYVCFESWFLGNFRFADLVLNVEYFTLSVWLGFAVELFEVISCIELLSDGERKGSVSILWSSRISE